MVIGTEGEGGGERKGNGRDGAERSTWRIKKLQDNGVIYQTKKQKIQKISFAFT